MKYLAHARHRITEEAVRKTQSMKRYGCDGVKPGIEEMGTWN